MAVLSILTTISVALWLVVGSAFPVLAGPKNPVQPLTAVRFEQMIKARGQRFAVVFMAAWCTPCIEELPDYVRIDKKYKHRGLNLVGASLDLEGPGAIQPLIDEHKVSFPVYWVGEEAIETFNIEGIPLLIFVEEGSITKRIKGKRPKSQLEQHIKRFLESLQK